MSDEGLFGPGSVTWRVHADPAMAVGGLRALMLQACHPDAIEGFLATSTFPQDWWGRLERTAGWVATVTFGTRDEAERASARVRRVHARLGVDRPDLLLWVHVTTVESFLTAYQRSGGRLSAADADRYVDEMREAARLVGVDPAVAPASVAEVEEYYLAVRPQLRVTAEARRSVLRGWVPPMPRWVALATPARGAWLTLVSTAAGLLPRWARRLYGLPGLPTTDVTAAATARAVRAGLLLVPEHLRASPPRKAAMERLSA